MKMSTKDLILCALFAAISCVLSQISIPIGTVPITMQVMAVYLAGVILGEKRGFISQLVYVVLGSIGVPVFAGFSGGIGAVVGPTGGFIIAFPFMTLIVGYVSDKYKKRIPIIISMVVASVFCYILGSVWLALMTKMSFLAAIKVAVLPFILFDIIKIIIVSIVAVSIRNGIKVGGLA
ncbi:biotin transporter BioY [Clostridium felsineum]|uniref:Biotin transporter n=1 Tax=Clostridium felsineum TaxID=36839 RepID=A0A1S8LHQ5_9CLOT|nr:biotin transporter BioY [Clostridium felsineum]URZ08582.1 Biotin transporter BioY2 [Clostridium felsineum]URZ13613.1 Biotin transporter BioY2 [Clostridium felsineum]